MFRRLEGRLSRPGREGLPAAQVCHCERAHCGRKGRSGRRIGMFFGTYAQPPGSAFFTCFKNNRVQPRHEDAKTEKGEKECLQVCTNVKKGPLFQRGTH